MKKKKVSNKLYLICSNVNGGYDLLCYNKGNVESVININEQINDILRKESNKIMQNTIKYLKTNIGNIIENGGINK
jgi:hypothetical protein